LPTRRCGSWSCAQLIVTCQEAIRGYQYLSRALYSLFPSWPEYRTGEITLLLTITIVVLLLPKCSAPRSRS